MRAHLAHEMLYYQIAKYIGSYYVALGGCDGIVFTAGIGENQPMSVKRFATILNALALSWIRNSTSRHMRCYRHTLNS